MQPVSNTAAVGSIGFLSSSVQLQEGDAGTAQTVALISQVIEEGKKDPFIRARAQAIVRDCPQADIDAQARAIYDWVQQNIRFTLDPVGVECVQDALFTLETGAGDCDDITSLIGSLTGSIGIPTRAVTVATDRVSDGFSHIYPEYLSGDDHEETWVALDVARSGARFGRVAEVGSYHRMRVWYFEPRRFVDVDESSDSKYADVQPGGLSAMFHGISGFGLGESHLGQSYDPTAEDYDPSGADYSSGDTPTSGNTTIFGPLAQDYSSWTPDQIIKAITAGGNSAANVIRSFNAYGLPGSLSAQGYRLGIGGQLIGPSGQVISAGGGISLSGIASSPILWVAGAGLAGLALAKAGR